MMVTSIFHATDSKFVPFPIEPNVTHFDCSKSHSTLAPNVKCYFENYTHKNTEINFIIMLWSSSIVAKLTQKSRWNKDFSFSYQSLDMPTCAYIDRIQMRRNNFAIQLFKMEKCEKSESHVNNAKLFWASVFFWLLACKQCEKPLDSLSERWAKHVLRMYWINWRLNESPCVNVTVLLIKQIVILRRLLIQPPPHVPFSLSFSHPTNAACVFVCFFLQHGRMDLLYNSSHIRSSFIQKKKKRIGCVYVYFMWASVWICFTWRAEKKNKNWNV